ncbi:MAG: sterol desaturase family protein [Methylococcales bacterium]
MEALLRLSVFSSVLVGMLCWEKLRPFRRFPQKKYERFWINLGLSGLNLILVRLLAGGGAYAAAETARRLNLGLFRHFDFPFELETVLSLLVLDFAIYLQHRLFHRVPVFWRFHKVHHSDPGFDTSTGLRFHAVEIVLSMYYKMALVVMLGTAPGTVVAFEIILNACALFNHGNVRIPDPWERRIRKILITPDMHRIHHCTDLVEQNRNYGFSLPWWDLLCKSYHQDPASDPAQMPIGLNDPNTPERPGFLNLLMLPFAPTRVFPNSSPSRPDREGLQ